MLGFSLRGAAFLALDGLKLGGAVVGALSAVPELLVVEDLMTSEDDFVGPIRPRVVERRVWMPPELFISEVLVLIGVLLMIWRELLAALVLRWVILESRL